MCPAIDDIRRSRDVPASSSARTSPRPATGRGPSATGPHSVRWPLTHPPWGGNPMPDVLVDRNDNGVALVTLNRPDSLNSMGGTLMAELGDALQDLGDDPDVRVVAVT